MEIYKITNKINNKIYIGKVYNRSTMERFKRHCNDAKPNAKSLIDRAIYKYGKENFIVEVIDTVDSLDELGRKEKFWISKYNSIDKNIGYNLTLGGDGGNTYQFKTKEEMIQIRKKLSQSKLGKNNPMSRSVKITNEVTGEVKIFDSMYEAKQFFNLKGHGTIISRCRGYQKPYNGWYIEWLNKDLCVSTIPDECKGVGSEMDADSKRAAIEDNSIEHIVSAIGNN